MLKPSLIRAVGFDLDETLYPSNSQITDHIRTIIAGHIQPRLDVTNPAQARAWFDAAYREKGSSRKILTELGFTEHESHEILDQSSSDPGLAKFLTSDPAICRLVLAIHNVYRTFLITTSTESSVRAKMTALGIDLSSFDHCVWGRTHGPKSEGTSFRLMRDTFKREYGIEPNETVYIGNSRKTDILPAQRAGMQTIAVGENIPEADAHVDSLHQITSLITTIL